MKREITVRTFRFLVTQGVILIGIMFAFLVLACFFFVRNATHWHVANIEQDLKVFAEQAERSAEVPKRGDLGAYTFFILNTEGKYVLPRLPRSDESEKVWQEYELKIIYEMQKRREGWSYYPERGRWDFRNGRYMLRYLYLPNMGWIVAGEGYLPGVLVLLEEMLTPALFIGMGLIALAAFVFMLINANWHFHRVIRAILRSQENNFIAVDGIPPSVKKDPRTLFRAEDRLPAMSEADGIIRGPSRRSFSAAVEDLPEEHGAAVSRIEEPRRPSSVPVKLEPRISVSPQEASKAEQRVSVLLKEEPPHRREVLGAVPIDTSDIRSPILRRAIEELREVKNK